MFRMHRKKATHDEAAMREAADALVADAEQMLTGRLPVPGRVQNEGAGWTCVAVLGHASWERLHALAGAGAGPDGSWEGALTFLAAELLTCAGTPDQLVEVQRAALVPLELDVLAGVVPNPVTPAKLVAVVRLRLDGARRGHHRGGRRAPPGR
jgi:hypothetical protein